MRDSSTRRRQSWIYHIAGYVGSSIIRRDVHPAGVPKEAPTPLPNVLGVPTPWSVRRADCGLAVRRADCGRPLTYEAARSAGHGGDSPKEESICQTRRRTTANVARAEPGQWRRLEKRMYKLKRLPDGMAPSVTSTTCSMQVFKTFCFTFCTQPVSVA